MELRGGFGGRGCRLRLGKNGMPGRGVGWVLIYNTRNGEGRLGIGVLRGGVWSWGLAARGETRAGIACVFRTGSSLSKLRVFHSILVVSPPRSHAKAAARHGAGVSPRAARVRVLAGLGRGWVCAGKAIAGGGSRGRFCQGRRRA